MKKQSLWTGNGIYSTSYLCIGQRRRILMAIKHWQIKSYSILRR